MASHSFQFTSFQPSIGDHMHPAQIIIISIGIYSIVVAKKNRKEQTLWVLLIAALLGWGGFFSNLPYLS